MDERVFMPAAHCSVRAASDPGGKLRKCWKRAATQKPEGIGPILSQRIESSLRILANVRGNSVNLKAVS